MKAWEGPQPYLELRPLLAHMRDRLQKEDAIYVAELRPVYEYYRGQAGLGDRSYVTGRYVEEPWTNEEDEKLNRLAGRRVWVIGDGDDVQRLDRHGVQIDAFGDRDGVMLYLYDLRGRH
jgi:hypothetical protein